MPFDVTAQGRRTLLLAAREAIAARLESRKPSWPERGPELDERRGAFVTLRRGRRLRGCIGRMDAEEALFDVVREMAEAAAFSDPRFPPLSAEELPSTRLEISVLSPMERCRVGDVEAGLHGAYLRFAGRSGVFLPQVAPEQGWDSAAFLEQLCLKAGVPVGSHLDPRAELYRFTAVVFGEDD